MQSISVIFLLCHLDNAVAFSSSGKNKFGQQKATNLKNQYFNKNMSKSLTSYNNIIRPTRIQLYSCQHFENDSKADHPSQQAASKWQVAKSENGVKDFSKFICTIFSILMISWMPLTHIEAANAESFTAWNSPETSALESLISSKASDTPTKSNKAPTSTSNKSENTEVSSSKSVKYWDAINSNSPELVTQANEKLLDYGVGTINTMYYDNTGGARFNNASMIDLWRALRAYNKNTSASSVTSKFSKSDLERLPRDVFVDRDGVSNIYFCCNVFFI